MNNEARWSVAIISLQLAVIGVLLGAILKQADHFNTNMANANFTQWMRFHPDARGNP